MKIAFLTHEPFYPPSGGGSAEAVYLIRELVAQGHDVELFCPDLPGRAGVEAQFGIRIHPFRLWAMGRYTRLRTLKYLLYPRISAQLAERVARSSRPDVIVSQHAVSAVSAARLKRRLRIPVVMNFLDHLTGFMETWPPVLAPRPLVRALKEYELNLPRRTGADGVLTVSDALADLFVERGYSRDRVLPIYYGFDAALFPYRGFATSREETPVLIMHGSLDHHHLREIALGGLAFAGGKIPGLRARLIGQRTAALEYFLAKARRELPQVALEAPGFVPYDQMASQLAAGSVGLVPYEESAGTHCAFVAKMVEYLAVGLPVVSTPLKSIRTYFANEPRVRFSDFTAEGFGRQIVATVRSSSERAEDQAQAASHRVRNELDWPVICRKAVRFIEAVTGRKRGRA